MRIDEALGFFQETSPPNEKKKKINSVWGPPPGPKSARFFYKEFITRDMQICYTGKSSLNEICPRLSECRNFASLWNIWVLWLEGHIYTGTTIAMQNIHPYYRSLHVVQNWYLYCDVRKIKVSRTYKHVRVNKQTIYWIYGNLSI